MYPASEPALFNFGCMIRLSSGTILSIKFSQCFSSVTARCVHDQAQRSVLMQPTMTAYSVEICFLPLCVRRITQQVWCCSLRHVVSNVSEAWVNSCEVRDEVKSPLVVTPFLYSIEAPRFSRCRGSRAKIVLVQMRVRSVSLLRYHIEVRHRHHDHFVGLRNDLNGITSLMNHQVQHVMDDYACNAQDD